MSVRRVDSNRSHNSEPKEEHQKIEHAPHRHEPVKPSRVYTEAEEKKLYRKIDLRILPILSFLYLLSFMDRGNIGNARLQGLEADLQMTGNMYAISLSVYFISYGLFEVPANLALKKLTPRTWLAFITVCWGIVMTCMGLVQNWAGLVAVRLLLGIAEAGLYPGVIFYLSLWYPRHLYQTRVSIFFASATIAGSFSGLLAYGIGFMDGVRGYSGWRWIFILEGLLTVVAGFFAYFIIVDYPETAKFLTEDEKAWTIWVRSSDQGKYGEADHVTFKFIKDALSDWQIPLCLLNYFAIDVALYSVALFMPTIVSFGTYTRPQVQLLTIPVYAVACAWVIICGILADRHRSRGLYMMINLVLIGIGFIIEITPAPYGVKYFALFLAASGAYAGLPNVVSWLSNNLAGQTKRGVGVATQIGVGNFIAIVSSNIYTADSAPRYITGHAVNLGFCALGLVTVPTYAFLLRRANKRKAAILALPEEERPVYTPEEARALGDKHYTFKYMI
ncbi:MFS general substrate transporter [Dioszegia hungarica]|uniref:MFS general substrate transporter n=1 Tax=Dioszegia hungarica TaxID=4972 RepID=A0AA38LRH7_9TREE|nr:MFS general substrate transporter [Dioszegia hungarica]KAI9632398.1 MFS general substrate transporter [Dioszegia hungarica]